MWGDFNIIRRVYENSGGSKLSPDMRNFDSFIREFVLTDSPSL